MFVFIGVPSAKMCLITEVCPVITAHSRQGKVQREGSAQARSNPGLFNAERLHVAISVKYMANYAYEN